MRATLLALLALAAIAAGSQQQRVLVLLDRKELEGTHSEFLGSLRSRGYDLDVKPISDKGLQLKSWDDWLYDKLVILGSKKGKGHYLLPPSVAGAAACGCWRCHQPTRPPPCDAAAALSNALAPFVPGLCLPRAGRRAGRAADPGVC